MARQRYQIDRSPVTPWIRTTSGPEPACWTCSRRSLTAKIGMSRSSLPGGSEAAAEERDQLPDRDVAVRPAAEVGQQVGEGQGAAVVLLEGLSQDHRVDRRQAQVGEETGLRPDGS